MADDLVLAVEFDCPHQKDQFIRLAQQMNTEPSALAKRMLTQFVDYMRQEWHKSRANEPCPFV